MDGSGWNYMYAITKSAAALDHPFILEKRDDS
jgi:hypothetical protein